MGIYLKNNIFYLFQDEYHVVVNLWIVIMFNIVHNHVYHCLPYVYIYIRIAMLNFSYDMFIYIYIINYTNISSGHCL